jgi:diacylglycerol kinase family enzyme
VTEERLLPAQADHVLILLNPQAGSGSLRRRRQVARLVDLLQQSQLTAKTVTDLDEMAEVAKLLHGEGRLRCAVGAGGDGTLHVLFNRLPAGVPLVMLPLGTENLLAKYVGHGRGPGAVAKVIEQGNVVRLDAGRANGRLFMIMASAGFDADVARRLDEGRSGNISHLSYLRPIWSSIRQYKYPRMRIELESPEGDRRIDACWCFVFNLPQYGFGMRFVPHADGSDGRLNVCTFRHGSFWQGLRYTTHLYLRRHDRLADCETAEATRIRVDADQSVPYELDGDPGGWLPLELDVVPQRLTLLVPAKDGA